MKSKIITAHIFFLSALGGTALACYADANSWLTASLGGVMLIAIVFIHRNWMRYVSELATKSDEILNSKPKNSTWSLNNLAHLWENQELLGKKFEVSAELISNLAAPEKTETNDILENDAIGKALQNIRVEMLRIKDEDNKRAWISQGLARFGEILRNKSEAKEYTNQIISNLAKYTKANQGALYIEYENENVRYLELMGSYACDKRKYAEGKVLEGEGVLGQCMLEKDYIFITDVPKDYIKITSGLGLATPGNIVIAPLIFNETFCGAIELAFFEIMKPHELEFLKSVCENIASEIISLKNIQHTQVLLEESNALTRELQSREEELKQNLEELAATQEEMARKQGELSGIVNAIDITLATAEFDLSGRFKTANDIFLKVMGYELDELSEKNYDFIMGHDQLVVMMWENLRLGKFFSGEFRMKDRAGKELWLTGTFNPIIVRGNVPEKILMFAQFTTQEKDKLNDLTGVVQALKSTLPVMEFNEEFACKTANEKALKIFGLSRLELRKKSFLDFIAPYYHAAWKKIQTETFKSEFSNVILPMITADHVTYFEITLSVIRNSEEKVTKVVVIFVKEVQERISVLAAV
jgi:PAS domain S-box-containing protein